MVLGKGSGLPVAHPYPNVPKVPPPGSQHRIKEDCTVLHVPSLQDLFEKRHMALLTWIKAQGGRYFHV